MKATTLRRLAVIVVAGGFVVARACPGDVSPPGGDVAVEAGVTVEARVLRVQDGDSIEVDVDGRTERVRYIGIDAEEMTDTRPRSLEMAHAAAAANRELVEDRRVILEFDDRRRDRYGRLLAYVRLGDTLVNEWLVREGYARAGAYPPNLRYQDRLEAAQDAARAAGRRIWDGRQ